MTSARDRVPPMVARSASLQAADVAVQPGPVAGALGSDVATPYDWASGRAAMPGRALHSCESIVRVKHSDAWCPVGSGLYGEQGNAGLRSSPPAPRPAEAFRNAYPLAPSASWCRSWIEKTA